MNLKTRIILIVCSFVVSGTVIISACKKSDVHRRRATPMNFVVPDGFPSPAFNFSQNPVTEEGFALGRKLFHDNRLSLGIDVTCSSCHQQHAAYTTFDHDLGHGTNHQHTRRNVPVIFNMAWHTEFEWDGRNKSLKDQTLACLTAPEKMAGEISAINEKIKSDTSYTRLFSDAFGDANITSDRIADALTQFVVMLVSNNSKYDKVKKGEAEFNSSEAAGYELFKTKCAGCHAEPLFTDLSFRNNGLVSTPFHVDYGRMEVTGDPADSLKFKVPTLRNVMLTGYYVHDGRFIAVGQLLDHYSEGITPIPTLDPSLQNGIPLTLLEKFYLEEFLFTLSDSTLISDPRFE
ncbi:MAG: cytochrome-c peroxidase [Chitinophagaceae bacterium]|nr:cytochrome-c peroxidase [Chitinophagaceae bacterium]